MRDVVHGPPGLVVDLVALAAVPGGLVVRPVEAGAVRAEADGHGRLVHRLAALVVAEDGHVLHRVVDVLEHGGEVLVLQPLDGQEAVAAVEAGGRPAWGKKIRPRLICRVAIFGGGGGFLG